MKSGGTLDNKLDTLWICSEMCRGLKQQKDHLLKMAAKRKALKNQSMLAAIKRQAENRERQRAIEAKRQVQMRDDLLKKQAATRTARIAEACSPEKVVEQVFLTPDQDNEIKWQEYRVRLREWEDGERDLRKRIAIKLPYEK